jgi:hypothetical protein
MSFTPGLQLPYGITPVNPVPVDGYSGPYATTAEALSNIPEAIRFPTMMVRIVDNDDNKMYWFKDGVLDSDLIEFSPTNANLLTFVAHPQNTSWLVNEAADFNSGNNANPTIYVFRGNIYKFKVAASIGHTLQIRSADGTTYPVGMPTSGTGSNTQTSGNYILWTVPFDAPDDLFYVDTANPTVMKGHIRVIPSLVAPITPSAQQGNANSVAYTSNTGSYSIAANSPIEKAIHIDSTVCISVNGVRRLLTDSNTSPFFFSRNGGSTQLLLNQVEAGDSLYVRPAYLEHGLEITDLILLEYFSGGTVTLAQPTTPAPPSTTYYWRAGSGTNIEEFNLVGGGTPTYENPNLTAIQVNSQALNSQGSNIGSITSFINSLTIGSTIVAQRVGQTDSGTYTIISKTKLNPGNPVYENWVIGVQYVSGTGSFSGAGALWSFQFI